MVSVVTESQQMFWLDKMVEAMPELMLYPLNHRDHAEPKALFRPGPQGHWTRGQLDNFLNKGHGIGCRRPGIFVIDLDDVKRDDDGTRFSTGATKNFEEFLPTLGLSIDDFEDTFSVYSPTGNRHIYLRLPENFRMHSAPEGKPASVDFLSSNRNLVCPGSPHWSGGVYEVDDVTKLTGVVNVMDCPEPLLNFIKREEYQNSDCEMLDYDASHLKTMLDALDQSEFTNHDDWLLMFLAAHNATAGSSEGCGVFEEWCRYDPKFEKRNIRYRWETLEPGGGITVGTLFKALADRSRGDVVRSIKKQFEPTAAELFAMPCSNDFLMSPEPRRVTGQTFVTVDDLISKFPKYNEPVVHELIREAEVGNVVAATKVGKTWLAYGLAFSVASGIPWLGRFPTVPGDVLYIDNELHEPTIAGRGRWVRDAFRKSHKTNSPYNVYIEPVRGLGWDLEDLAKYLKRVTEQHGPKRFKLIVLDALYRFMPEGNDENSNGMAKDIMNLLDAMARNTGTAIMTILHSPKGDMSGRDVRDLHSGAASFARAADLQIGVRQHEEDDHFVFEAINRSFCPVEPITIRKDMPLFTATDVEPAVKLRKTTNDARTERRDRKGVDEVVRIIEEAGEPITRSKVSKRWQGRVNPDRLRKLINIAVSEGAIEVAFVAKPERSQYECEFYQVTLEADEDVARLF